MYFIPVYVTLNIIYGIIPPYLPILMRNHGYRPALVGVLLAIAEGTGIMGPFLFGRLTDRHGKYKGYIVLAYFFTAAAALPLALFVHPVLSAVLVAMLTVGYRSANPLIEAVTTINLGEKGNYGKIRVSGSISYVCFVFFLQWVPFLRPVTAFNISFWMCLTAALAITAVIILPSRFTNTKPEKPRAGTVSGEAVNRTKIWTPFFIMGLIIIALNRLAMTPIYSFFSLFLVEYMKWDAVGIMWALAGLAEIPFIYFSHRLIRRFGAMPILAFTSAMVALRLGLYAVFPFRAGIIAAQLLHSFCYGLFHPAAVAFISDCVPPEQRSFGMTLYLSLGCGVPMFIGNFIGGFVVDHAGYRALFGSFTIFAILSAVIYLVFRLCYNRREAYHG